MFFPKEKKPPIKTKVYSKRGKYWERMTTVDESIRGLGDKVLRMVIRPNWLAKAKKQRPTLGRRRGPKDAQLTGVSGLLSWGWDSGARDMKEKVWMMMTTPV